MEAALVLPYCERLETTRSAHMEAAEVRNCSGQKVCVRADNGREEGKTPRATAS